jgi:hypothetical protein
MNRGLGRRMFFKKLMCWFAALFGLQQASCRNIVDEIRNEDSEEEPLLDLPPRGLAMLHAMAPEAEEQIVALSEIMLESNLKNLALAVLMGGTFGSNSYVVTRLIEEFNKNGRRCHLLLYLTDGASQRRFKNTAINAFGTRISPEEFRDRIQSDEAFQAEYLRIAEEAVPLLDLNARLGGLSRVVPQLEDNQSDASFGAMWSLIKPVVSTSFNTQIGRNPCVQCWPDNGSEIPDGFFREQHIHGGMPDVTFGVVSNDGMDYFLPGQTSEFQPQTELPNLSPAMIESGARGNWFVLWSAKFQGLGAPPIKAPSERDYALPTQAERETLVSFLRQQF